MKECKGAVGLFPAIIQGCLAEHAKILRIFSNGLALNHSRWYKHGSNRVEEGIRVAASQSSVKTEAFRELMPAAERGVQAIVVGCI